MTAARLLTTIAILVAGAVTVSGAWLVAPWLARNTGQVESTEKSEPARTPPPVVAKQEKVEDKADLGFDVVRIGPDEPSVFAGRAPPDSVVSITANGKSVTTAKANEDGEWVALPDAQFRPGDYDITLEARVTRPGRGPETTTRSYKVAVAGQATPPSEAAPIARPASVGREQPRPRPITFVYDEATFTSDGKAAAAALAQYIRSNGFDVVGLSGHADERGSREHNVALSRRRAEVVAQYLRESGYSGQFKLIAVGEAEPYAAIDRSALPREHVFQYDRRVELRPAQ